MSHERTRESPPHHPRRERPSLLSRLPCPMMRHLCPLVRHLTPPEIRRNIENRPGKSEMRPEIQKMGPKSPFRCPGAPAIGTCRCDRGVENHRARAWAVNRFFVPSPAAARVPGLNARVSAAHGRDRPVARPRRKLRRYSPTSRRATPPTRSADVPHGTFLSHQRTRLRRNEPEFRRHSALHRARGGSAALAGSASLLLEAAKPRVHKRLATAPDESSHTLAARAQGWPPVSSPMPPAAGAQDDHRAWFSTGYEMIPISDLTPDGRPSDRPPAWSRPDDSRA